MPTARNLRPNPEPWVTQAIARNWERISNFVEDPALMPLQAAAKAKGRSLVITIEEYGCGAYGCVMPTLDESVVFKITTDESEAEFIEKVLPTIEPPEGIVDYFGILRLEGHHKNYPLYALWREEANQVGEMISSLPKGRQVRVDDLMHYQKSASDQAWRDLKNAKDPQRLYAAARKRRDEALAMPAVHTIVLGQAPTAEGSDPTVADLKDLHHADPALRLAALLARHEVCAQELADDPDAGTIGAALLDFLEQGILIGDVHSGNVGRVDREGHKLWAITDPGHVAVLGDPWRPEAAIVTVVVTESSKLEHKRRNGHAIYGSPQLLENPPKPWEVMDAERERAMKDVQVRLFEADDRGVVTSALDPLQLGILENARYVVIRDGRAYLTERGKDLAFETMKEVWREKAIAAGPGYWRQNPDGPAPGTQISAAIPPREQRATKAEADALLADLVPLAVSYMLDTCGTFTSCGNTSAAVAEAATMAGVPTMLVSDPGHFYNVIPLREGGGILVDITQKSFSLPYGSPRDAEDDEEGRAEMKAAFAAARRDPWSVVVVEPISEAAMQRKNTKSLVAGIEGFMTMARLRRLAAIENPGPVVVKLDRDLVARMKKAPGDPKRFAEKVQKTAYDLAVAGKGREDGGVYLAYVLDEMGTTVDRIGPTLVAMNHLKWLELGTMQPITQDEGDAAARGTIAVGKQRYSTVMLPPGTMQGRRVIGAPAPAAAPVRAAAIAAPGPLEPPPFTGSGRSMMSWMPKFLRAVKNAMDSIRPEDAPPDVVQRTYGTEKVFLFAIRDAIGLGMDDFQSAILYALRDGQIVVTRMDMPGALNEPTRRRMIHETIQDRGSQFDLAVRGSVVLEEGPVPVPATFERDFAAAFDELEAATRGRPNYQLIYDVRRKLPQYSKAQFDSGLEELRRRQIFTYDSADGRHQTYTHEQRLGGLRQGHEMLMHVARR